MPKINYFKIFKALADQNRLQLLKKIASADEICVCKLMDDADMAQSRLSYHLKLLLDAGLINVKPQGKWHFYSVNKNVFDDVFSNKTVKEILTGKNL